MNEEPNSENALSHSQSVLNEAFLDLGDCNSSAQPGVADDLVLDLEYEEPASASVLQARGPVVVESAPATENAALAEAWAPEAALLAAEPTHEEQHVAELQEWEIISEAVPQAVPVSPTANQESVDSTLALSPEIIDAIARRAVEHLSEKVVREIAWEVVPELAELLIKKKLEEQK